MKIYFYNRNRILLVISFFAYLLCFSQTTWDTRNDPIKGYIDLYKCNETDVVVEVFGHLKEVGLFQKTLKAEVLLQGRRPDGIYEDIGKRYVTLEQTDYGRDNSNRRRLRWGWFHEYRVNFDSTDGNYTEFAAVITETDGNGGNSKFYSWFGLYGYTKKKSLPNTNLITINGSLDQNHQVFSLTEVVNISLRDINYCGCADVFFSLQKVNKWWSPLEEEVKNWFTRPVIANQGTCVGGGEIVQRDYTLMEISQMLDAEIELNNYYRLKIAIGIGPWNAIDKIFYVGDDLNVSFAEKKINNVKEEEINTDLLQTSFNEDSVSVNENSIEELKMGDIKIYPNPVEDFLYIDNLSDKIYFKLLDLSNREYNLSRSNNKYIDTAYLSKGIYLLVFFNSETDSVIKTEKILVK